MASASRFTRYILARAVIAASVLSLAGLYGSFVLARRGPAPEVHSQRLFYLAAYGGAAVIAGACTAAALIGLLVMRSGRLSVIVRVAAALASVAAAFVVARLWLGIVNGSAHYRMDTPTGAGLIHIFLPRPPAVLYGPALVTLAFSVIAFVQHRSTKVT
jgi:hypothetical protein